MAAASGVVACSISVNDKEVAAARAERYANVEPVVIPVSGRADYDSIQGYHRPAMEADGPARSAMAIIIPGTPSDATYWGAVMDRLDPEIDVYTIERPGYKRSGPARAVTDLDEQASVIAALIEDDESDVILVGNSYGASVALVALEKYPDRIDGVMLVSPYVFPVSGRTKTLFNAFRYSPLRFLGGTSSHRVAQEVSAHKEQSARVIEIAKAACAPVSVLQGDKDDTVFMEDARAVFELFPDCANAEFSIIADGDHHLAVHKPQETAAAINRFMVRVISPAKTGL